MFGFLKRRKKRHTKEDRKTEAIISHITKPRVDPINCMRCGACASVCPLNIIEVSDALARIGDRCNNCGLCVRACPVGGISP